MQIKYGSSAVPLPSNGTCDAYMVYTRLHCLFAAVTVYCALPELKSSTSGDPVAPSLRTTSGFTCVRSMLFGMTTSCTRPVTPKLVIFPFFPATEKLSNSAREDASFSPSFSNSAYTVPPAYGVVKVISLAAAFILTVSLTASVSPGKVVSTQAFFNLYPLSGSM